MTKVESKDKKKFGKWWFENKLKQIRHMGNGYSKVLTATKGYKANGQNKQVQRIMSLLNLAKEKGVKLDVLSGKVK